MFDDALRIDLVHLNGAAVLAVTGEIDMASVPALQTAIDEGRASARSVVLDLAGVTFMDSSGLGLLVKESVGPGVALVLRNTPEVVRRLLDLAGLDKVVKLEPE